MQQFHSAAAAREMLDILTGQFTVPPVRLHWYEGVKDPKLLGFYHPRSATIEIYSDRIEDSELNTIESVVCHEFTHHFCVSKFKVLYLREDQDQHGLTWFMSLLNIVEYWYGSAHKYPWPEQYKASAFAIPWILKHRRSPTHSP